MDIIIPLEIKRKLEIQHQAGEKFMEIASRPKMKNASIVELAELHIEMMEEAFDEENKK